MKKTNLLFAFAMFVALSFTGCELPGSGTPEEPTDPNAPVDAQDLLTPDEQKQFLVNVGQELINVFNPEDQKEVAELSEDLYNKYKDYDWDAIEDEFSEEIDDFYSSELESFFGMPKRVIDAINGKQKVTMEDIKIVLSLSKFGRIIEFNDLTKSIRITHTDDATLTARFYDTYGALCELQVWGEGKEITGSYTYEDYHWEYPEIWNEEYGYWESDWENGTYVYDGKRTIEVKVPTTIKMHFKHGDKYLMSMTYNWDFNFTDNLSTSLNLQVINMSFTEESKTSATESSAAFSFSYNDKVLVAGAANLPKYKIIAWPGGNDITEEEGEDWLEQYDDKYKTLLGQLGKGEAKVDILGKVQIKGGFTDGGDLVDANDTWEDKYYNYNYDDYRRYFTCLYWTYDWVWNESIYDYEKAWYSEEQQFYYDAWWERPYCSKEACDAKCAYINKYLYLSMFYNNTTTEQAQLKMNTYQESGTEDPASWLRWYPESDKEYNGYYYTSLPGLVKYTCYDVEPIMYFPKEETSTAIMTYFNSSKFLNLVDLVEDLANRYAALDENHLIFDEDFVVDLD